MNPEYTGEFQPEVLSPAPDPWFQRELKKIDPNLRLIWGYHRYLVKNWVVERRMSAERYFTCYASLFEQNKDRYVEQPIFDTSQPLYDEEGGQTSYRKVGSRKFDLAPEWEWLRTISNPDGSFKQPDASDLLLIRREYAWNRNHPYSRERFEREQKEKDEAKKREHQAKKEALINEGIDEAFRELGIRKTVGQPERIMEGTDIYSK